MWDLQDAPTQIPCVRAAVAAMSMTIAMIVPEYHVANIAGSQLQFPSTLKNIICSLEVSLITLTIWGYDCLPY